MIEKNLEATCLGLTVAAILQINKSQYIILQVYYEYAHYVLSKPQMYPQFKTVTAWLIILCESSIWELSTNQNGLAQRLKEEEFENCSNGLIKFVGMYIWENMSKLHHFIARMYWCKSWSTFLDFMNMFLQFICNNIEVVCLCFLPEYLLDSPM